MWLVLLTIFIRRNHHQLFTGTSAVPMCCYGDRVTNGEAKCQIMVLLISCSRPWQWLLELRSTVRLKHSRQIRLLRLVIIGFISEHCTTISQKHSLVDLVYYWLYQISLVLLLLLGPLDNILSPHKEREKAVFAWGRCPWRECWFAYIIEKSVLIKSPEVLGLNRHSVIFREPAFHLKQSGANNHLDNTSTYLLFFFRSTFTALVFCYVKCVSGNFQILKGVKSKFFLCRTAP